MHLGEMDWKIPQITSMHYFDFHFAYWHWEVSTLFHLRKKNQWNRPCRQKNCSKWAPPQRHQAQKIRHPPAFAFPAPSLSLLVPPGRVFATPPADWNTTEKSMESRICLGSCIRSGGGKQGRRWLGCLDKYSIRKETLKKFGNYIIFLLLLL